MKSHHPILYIFFAFILFQSCKKKNENSMVTPTNNYLENEKTIEEKKPIDYKKIDCDSIKNLFEKTSLLIGEKFENQLLEHYKCLNAQDSGKYQKQLGILERFIGTSNEGKGVIMARDTTYRYHLLNDKLEFLQEDRKYMTKFFNDVSFVAIDTSLAAVIPLYYDKKTEYKEVRFPAYLRMINREGEFISKRKYQKVLFMSNEKYIMTRKLMSWGLTDYKGNDVLNHKYREIGDVLGDTMVIARYKRKWGVVDFNGTPLSRFKYEDEWEVKDAIDSLNITTKTRLIRKRRRR